MSVLCAAILQLHEFQESVFRVCGLGFHFLCVCASGFVCLGFCQGTLKYVSHTISLMNKIASQNRTTCVSV